MPVSDLDPRLAEGPLERLHATLRAEGLDLAAPTAVSATPRGGSNLTCFVQFGGDELVVRMPPGGAGGGTHNLIREAHVLRRLHGTGVPVPEVLHASEDESVVGSPFVVSRRVPGIPLLPETPLGPAEVAAAERSLVEHLAMIHRLEPAVAFDRARSPQAYLLRQLELWSGQLEALGEAGAPFREVGSWLRTRVPEPERAAIVHGDYGTHNVLFESGPSRQVTAVLDWELTTVGDPHADLAWFLVHALRVEPDPPDAANHLDTRPGRLDVVTLLTAYVAAGGARPPAEHLPFYEVLARWRMAVILLGLAGNADSVGDEALAIHHRARAERQRALADVLVSGAPPLLAG